MKDTFGQKSIPGVETKLLELVDASGHFAYSHVAVELVNAAALGLRRSSYRLDYAAIIDVPNEFIKIFPAPEMIFNMMEAHFVRFANPSDRLQVALAHCEFIAIHPFCNGNGRTARFIADLSLIALGHKPFLNQQINRLEYYEAVRTYLSHSDISPMLKIICSG